MVIKVFIAEHYGIEALRHQFTDVVLDAGRIAVIDKAPGNSRRQSGALASLPQEDAAGVRTDTSAIESASERSPSKGVKLKLFAGTLCSLGCFHIL